MPGALCRFTNRVLGQLLQVKSIRMGVRKSVFASKPERLAYEHLSRTWGDKYRIYHNLPFLNVFDTSELIDFSNWELKKIELDQIDLSRLKKTSIDFTLCDDADRPLLCIEFDGLADGYNVGNKYHTELPESPWRKIIMNLKLKVAHGSLFPFVVLGTPQFDKISKRVEVAIVDGIIGDILAKKAVTERISKGFTAEEAGISQEEFDELAPSQQHELIQDWVFGIEIEADFEHNPIYRVCADLQKELGVHSFRVEWTEYPNADRAKNVKERAALLNRALLHGSKVTVEHPELGSSSATVMLPNFKTYGVSALTLSQELAHLIALDRLKDK